jgi:proteasome lid subunit RPN8/RPN11
MILIKKDALNQIIDHAGKDLPNEACGYLAGKDNTILFSYQLRNTDQSPEHYSFDPSEQFQVLRETRTNGLQIMACYHSHPSTPARPSQEDINLAYDPDLRYIIISLASNEPVVKVFRIINGEVTGEELVAVD